MSFKILIMFLFAGTLQAAFLSETSAQGVYDWRHQRMIAYERVFPTLNDDVENENQVQIVYPQFRELPDGTIQEEINRKIKAILFDQVKTDSFQTKLQQHFKVSLPIYFSTYYLAKDPLREYGQGSPFPTAYLKNVDFVLLSCFNAVVTMAARFEYTAALPRQHTFTTHYYEFYYFDLSSGKVYRPADVFKASSESQLLALLSEQAKQKLKRNALLEDPAEEDFKIDAEYYIQEGGDGAEEGFDESVKKDSVIVPEEALVDFNLREGFAFPRAFSLAFYIPTWCSGCRNIGEQDIQVRFTFDEIRSYLNPKGPFASLINFQLKQSTRLREQHNPENEFRNEPYIPRIKGEREALFFPGKVKTLTIKRLREKFNGQWVLVENGQGIFKQIDYDKHGHIRELRRYGYGDENLNGKGLFTFDQYHNLIKHTVITDEDLSGNKPGTVIEYSYDQNRNLIQATSPDKWYYYEDSIMIEESQQGVIGGGPDNRFVVSYVNDAGLPIRSLIFYEDGYMDRTMRYDSGKRLLLSYDKYHSGNDEPFSGVVNVYNDKGKL